LLRRAIFNFWSKNIPSHFFLVITSSLTYIIWGNYFKFPQHIVISHRVAYVVYKPALRPVPTLLIGDVLIYLYDRAAVTVRFPSEYKRFWYDM
jgi:hypothetical protein